MGIDREEEYSIQRPADPTVFKKSQGERKYNTISKFQSRAEKILADREVSDVDRATALAYYNYVEANLQNESIAGYLSGVYSKEEVEQILEEKRSIQQQLKLALEPR
jgi:hypothetical protein